MMLLAKLSLFILYCQIFALSHKMKLLIYVGIASISIVYAGSSVVYVVFCIPKSGSSFYETLISQRCSVPSQKMTYVIGPFGVISDFYLLGLPIPVILQMQMPQKHKIGICAVFLTGFLWVLRF